MRVEENVEGGGGGEWEEATVTLRIKSERN